MPGKPDIYYLKLQPGTPLPPDLPADAQRYRLVRGDEFRDRTGLPAGLAFAMAVAGIGLALIDAPAGLVGAVFGGALLAAGWAYATVAPTRYVPSDKGAYVRAPRSVVAERLGALAGPPRLSAPTRALCGAMGAFAIVAVALVVAGRLGDGILAESIVRTLGVVLLPSAIGAGFTWLAVKGEVPFITQGEIPASPWFHSLADPSSPLPDDAPITGPRVSGDHPDGPGTERRA